MESPRIKVERARKHIQELQDCYDCLPSVLYEVQIFDEKEVDPSSFSDRDVLLYRPLRSVSKYLGAVAGDAVNNLRESLDYWIRALARELALPNPGRLHFPFSEDSTKLKDSKYFPKVKKDLPLIAKFISDEIKPSRDTNLLLWAASSMCNDNKHNDFLPNVGATSFDSKSIWINGSPWKSSAFMEGPADMQQQLMIAPSGSIALFGTPSVAVEAFFPKDAIFEGEDVLSTLRRMAKRVEETLNVLEKEAEKLL